MMAVAARPTKFNSDPDYNGGARGPADWKAGDPSKDGALWLIDMVAPFGGLDQALKDLRENVFPGKRMKMLQAAPGGRVAVVEW